MGHSRQSKQDRDLVLAFQSGERSAYDEIYRRYEARVHHTCMRILGNPADAAEAAQETFLRGFRALPSFNGRYHLGAWLARIATNVSLDTLRARSRSVPVVTSTDEHHQEDRLSTADPPADERVAVAETLTELDPLYGEALVLRAVAGLSHREMAARLQMTPAQVKSLLHRSRNSFKRAWEQASGWALAPLGCFRTLRTKDDHIATASPATGLLLERVATSAVAAVMAVAGFSGPSSPSQPAEPRSEAAPIAEVAEAVDPEGSRAAEAAAQGLQSEAKKSNQTNPLAPILKLKGSIESKVAEEEGEPSDDDIEVPTSQGKRPLPQPAEEAVEEVERLIGEDDDGERPL